MPRLFVMCNISKHLWPGIAPNLIRKRLITKSYADAILVLIIYRRAMFCYVYRMNVVAVSPSRIDTLYDTLPGITHLRYFKFKYEKSIGVYFVMTTTYYFYILFFL